MMEKHARGLLATFMGLSALILIASSDWKIAIGVFFIIWADNIDKKAGDR